MCAFRAPTAECGAGARLLHTGESALLVGRSMKRALSWVVTVIVGGGLSCANLSGLSNSSDAGSSCGATGEPCCNGATCANGLTCGSGVCLACGGVGEPCCGGATCDNGLRCGGGLCVSSTTSSSS